MTECIFCKIISGDIPSHKVYEDENTLAFLDISPVNPGHTLVIPKAHAENVLVSKEEDVHASVLAVRKIAPAILASVNADSMNLASNIGAAAGQSVFHTHFHIIPRTNSDGREAWKHADANQGDLSSLAQMIRKRLSV